ncbi:hypothetical protein B0I35DRAFT_444360 [Stachybotrys elegans]|uniref:BZIP domain-containing protein n=1 Tax=Stachybotrys elegans TaxID=80388 RepID=A0A8K0SB66_9HYPO|nr:hypothetical protein B0I35DRAFT_444360 [Stachybotrys elegans]
MTSTSPLVLSHALGNVADPLLNISYTDFSSIDFSAHNWQVAKPLDGGQQWDQFNFQLSLLNQLPVATPQQTSSNQPTATRALDTKFHKCTSTGDQDYNGSRDPEQGGEKDDKNNILSPTSRSQHSSKSASVMVSPRHSQLSFPSNQPAMPSSPKQASAQSPKRKMRTRKHSVNMEETKHNKLLERNRQAASRCRQKKKEGSPRR